MRTSAPWGVLLEALSRLPRLRHSHGWGASSSAVGTSYVIVGLHEAHMYVGGKGEHVRRMRVLIG